MPKTIAITPSWYWPAGTTRVTGIPPFYLHEMLVERFARHRPGQAALVSGSERLTGAELDDTVRRAGAAIVARAGEGATAVVSAGATLEGVVLVLAALGAGARVTMVDPASGAVTAATPPAGAANGSGDGIVLADATAAAALGGSALRLGDLLGDGAAPAPPPATAIGLGDAAVAVATGSGGAFAWHSHRSLLAMAVSIATFYRVDASVPWVSDLPLSTWAGLASVATALVAGATVVLAGSEPLPQAIAREGARYACTDLDSAAALTRDAKRDVKNVRGLLAMLLLAVPGAFDPDQRRRVGRSFDCPALTVHGNAETGPDFASHPSWYLDESVGIPITNAHVVPVDPRSGTPIQTLWELVELARVTVGSPANMVGYDAASGLADPVVDGRVTTSTIASSDANGMIYLMPD